MAEIALKQGELCGAWNYHWREGNPDKFLDQALTVPGLGHVMSPSSRPSLLAGSWTDYNIRAQDNLRIVGQYTDGGWSWDSAHPADMASPQYLLTGDPWYLEEMYFLAGVGVMATHGYHYTTYGGRGPTGKEGHIFNDGQTRSQAWVLRNRIHAHSITPDTAPEKAWLGRLINDTLAAWEGARNITGTVFEGTSMWNWGKSAYVGYFGKDATNAPLGPPPLHHWMIGNAASISTDSIDTNITSAVDSPWMMHFVMFALGRAEELGYPADALRQYLATAVVGELASPGFNPHLSASYRLPTIRKSDRGYFQSWPEVQSGFLPSYIASAQSRFLSGSGIGDTEHGYPNIALAAASYVSDIPNGGAAWEFMRTNVLSNPLLDNNPKWALVPRPRLTPFQQWQIRYFGSATSPESLPSADPLRKGMSNTNQFLAGLNPTNPQSLFRILSAERTNDDVLLTWQAGRGRTNVVQWNVSQEGMNAGFLDMATVGIAPGDGDVITNLLDTGAATNPLPRFYRLRLGP